MNGAINAPAANVICKRLSAAGLPLELSLTTALLIMLTEPLPIPISINAAYITGTGGRNVITSSITCINAENTTIVAFLPIREAIGGLTKLARRLPIANADKKPPATL